MAQIKNNGRNESVYRKILNGMRTFILKTKQLDEGGLQGILFKDGNPLDVIIPKTRLSGFNFKKESQDSEGKLREGLLFKCVMNEINGNIYLDKRDSSFYTYDSTKELSDKFINESIQLSKKNEEYPYIIYRLLELERIGGLSSEDRTKLVNLYKEKKMDDFKNLLIKLCGLYSYIFDSESQLLERKSSLAHPAVISANNTEDPKNIQLDVISQTIVGAGNAQQIKDFHLIVGITDDGVLTDNIAMEMKEYWQDSEKNFIDVFTNRLSQVTMNSTFVMSLNINFLTIEGHRLLDIAIPNWTGDILYCKKKVYLRVQATTQLLEGERLVNFAKNFYKK